MSKVLYPFGHFPSPAQHGVGPSLDFPIGLTLAEAMRWYWRIKRWQVAFTIASLTSPYGQISASGLSIVACFVPTADGSTLIPDETWLVLPSCYLIPDPATPPVIQGAGTITYGSPPATYDFDFSGSTVQLGLEFPQVLAGDLFYPQVYLGATLSGLSEAGQLSAGILLNLEDAADEGYSFVPVSFAGQPAINAPFRAGFFSYFGANNVTVAAAGVNVAVTAVAYWSYDGMYDTSTGAMVGS